MRYTELDGLHLFKAVEGSNFYKNLEAFWELNLATEDMLEEYRELHELITCYHRSKLSSLLLFESKYDLYMHDEVVEVEYWPQGFEAHAAEQEELWDLDDVEEEVILDDEVEATTIPVAVTDALWKSMNRLVQYQLIDLDCSTDLDSLQEAVTAIRETQHLMHKLAWLDYKFAWNESIDDLFTSVDAYAQEVRDGLQAPEVEDDLEIIDEDLEELVSWIVFRCEEGYWDYDEQKLRAMINNYEEEPLLHGYIDPGSIEDWEEYVDVVVQRVMECR